MSKSKKILFSLIGAGLLAAMLTLGLTGFGLYRYVSAAVTPTPVPGQSSSPDIMSQYWALFVKSFASNLGVDQGKLDSAFVAAINSTLDQAVKDGKITQAQADSVKSRYAGGLSASNGAPFGFGRGFGGFGGFGFFGGRGVRGGQLITSTDIASALGMNVTDLNTALQSGKSIADLANTQNKDLATVKSTLLADVKTRLDSQVTAKTLTQSQADQLYQNLTNSIDAMLNSTRPMMGGRGGFPGFGMMGPGGNQLITSADIAGALGMTQADVNTAIQSGKSIADLAKAQNKDLAAVKTTLLADAKTKLDSEVTNKTLTQAQADKIYQNFTNSIDNTLNNTHPFMGGPGGRFRGPSQNNPGVAPKIGA